MSSGGSKCEVTDSWCQCNLHQILLLHHHVLVLGSAHLIHWQQCHYHWLGQRSPLCCQLVQIPQKRKGHLTHLDCCPRYFCLAIPLKIDIKKFCTCNCYIYSCTTIGSWPVEKRTYNTILYKNEINLCTRFQVPDSCVGWVAGPWINPAWQKQFSMRLGRMLSQEAVSMSTATFKSVVFAISLGVWSSLKATRCLSVSLFSNGIWLICTHLDPWPVVWKFYLLVDAGFWCYLHYPWHDWMHCWQLKALYSCPASTSDHGSNWWARFGNCSCHPCLLVMVVFHPQIGHGDTISGNRNEKVMYCSCNCCIICTCKDIYSTIHVWNWLL